MRRRSLKWRIVLWFGGMVAPILLLFSLGLYYFFNQSFLTAHKSHLDRLALRLDAHKATAIRSGDWEMPLPSETAAALVRGERIIARSTAFAPEDAKRFEDHPEDFFTRDHGETLSLYNRYRFTQPFAGAILLRRDGVDDEVETLTDTLMWLDPILLLLLLFAAYRVTERILRPIRSTAQIAAQTSATHLPRPIPLPKYDDEIRDLVTAFNTMVARLSEGIERIERFNSDVSHELRTPLTVIRGEIDLALRKEREAPSLRHTLTTLQSEVARLETLVHNLLLLSRHDPERIRKDFETVSLDTLLLETLEGFQSALQTQKLHLSIAAIAPVTLEGNPTLLRTLLSNLIDNAIKYTPEGRSITLSLTHDDRIRFTVTDEGIGIAADALHHITERFYRADTARSRALPGFGLGLAMVETIADLHGAKVRFSSQEGKGTRVEVVWG